MAALAFVAAVLLSQIDQNNAAQGPFVELPCGNWCTCADRGYTGANASAASLEVTGDYYLTCCAQPAAKPCIQWVATGGSCDSGTQFDLTKMQTPAGATDATAKAACCKPHVVTCADVTCNSRRRRDAEYYKPKTSAVATTTCSDNNDCETKCCEKDTTVCGGSSSYSCPAGKRAKTFEVNSCTVTGATAQETETFTAASMLSAATTADYEANCCEDKPLCSTVTCPAYMEAKTGTDLKGDTFGECCDVKTTACSTLCGGGMSWTIGSDMCGVGGTRLCASTTCTDADTALDDSKVFADGATAAEKKTACCVSNPPSTSSAMTCATYAATIETQAAATKGAAGSTSAARFNRASAAVSALVALAVVLAL